jgi:hypothetical protein
LELWGISDPDVTLTDYGLALVCSVIVWRLWTGHGFGKPRFWLLVFFTGAGLAALFGGTVHGFFELEGTPAHYALWSATLVSVGVAALGAWGTGARLVLRDGLGSMLIGLASVEFLAYSTAVIAGYHDFEIAVLQYLPATVFLTIVLIVANRRAAHPGYRMALLGMVLTFVGAGVQQFQLGIHPVNFDHNAVYHVIQALALVFVYRGLTAALRR